jgi:hypothetical protein
MTKVTLHDALASIPSPFRDRLLSEYEESQRAAAGADWEKVGLKAGKICEIAYCILQGICTGTYPPKIEKPKNMQDACRSLETRAASSTPRSAKIRMPRLIAAIYEMRNNRAIGHAGGDVQPNEMDGLLFNQAIKWMMAEFVRQLHNVPLSEARKLVDELSVRWSAAMWEADGRKRVLIQGLDMQQKVLSLLYFSDMKATLEQLREWLDITNITNFKTRYLAPLHSYGLIDFNQRTGAIHLLPPGAKEVEDEILVRLAPR